MLQTRENILLWVQNFLCRFLDVSITPSSEHSAVKGDSVAAFTFLSPFRPVSLVCMCEEQQLPDWPTDGGAPDPLKKIPLWGQPARFRPFSHMTADIFCSRLIKLILTNLKTHTQKSKRTITKEKNLYINTFVLNYFQANSCSQMAMSW